ncbi:hypothetical protein [Citrobacter farmeri]|uniref:hypothetical protein n=1 Tax=Citrobacter farmeri TaxID=67824 RepID=UPI001902B02D|nr:hypothetical protein [Citrobacter farmeri]MBJ9134412.1 hypothetical protein [Citrobacter farmeri]
MKKLQGIIKINEEYYDEDSKYTKYTTFVTEGYNLECQRSNVEYYVVLTKEEYESLTNKLLEKNK